MKKTKTGKNLTPTCRNPDRRSGAHTSTFSDSPTPPSRFIFPSSSFIHSHKNTLTGHCSSRFVKRPGATDVFSSGFRSNDGFGHVSLLVRGPFRF